MWMFFKNHSWSNSLLTNNLKEPRTVSGRARSVDSGTSVVNELWKVVVFLIGFVIRFSGEGGGA